MEELASIRSLEPWFWAHRNEAEFKTAVGCSQKLSEAAREEKFINQVQFVHRVFLWILQTIWGSSLSGLLDWWNVSTHRRYLGVETFRILNELWLQSSWQRLLDRPKILKYATNISQFSVLYSSNSFVFAKIPKKSHKKDFSATTFREFVKFHFCAKSTIFPFLLSNHKPGKLITTTMMWLFLMIIDQLSAKSCC